MSTLWNKLAHSRNELLSAEHSPRVLAARRSQTYQGKIGELNRWVDEVRIIITTSEQVPYFDPAAARDGARVLLLFQDPSQEAEAGSGFISRHNNDPTARNAYLAANKAGLSYDYSLHWNVVPWWVNNPKKPKRTSTSQAVKVRPFLVKLIELLDPTPGVCSLGPHIADCLAQADSRRASPSATKCDDSGMSAPEPALLP